MGGYIGARAGSLSTTTVANVQDVTATDTTPEVTIINNTHEDTDGGREGKVIFKGQQSGGEESTLAEIQASHDGTADDEKADLIFRTNDGSDGASPTERVRIDSNGSILTATLGTDNVHLGEGAGASIASGGAQNVVIGKDAGTSLITGTDNTFVGMEAGKNTTDRNHNTGLGNETLKTNVNGAKNTAVGSGALLTMNPSSDSDTFNTAVGYDAGAVITTGIKNTAIGALALDANTTSDNNTAVGYQSLTANTTGASNVSIGGSALVSNTTASSNTAVGADALGLTTTAGSNTAVGRYAGYNNVSGDNNVYIGGNSSVGGAGYSATGSDNTFVGSTAGYEITSGQKNTIIGRFDGNQDGLDIRTSSNNIVISDGDGNARLRCNQYGALSVRTDIDQGIYVFTGGTNNTNGKAMEFFDGDSHSCGVIRINQSSNTVSYNTSSDHRLKENVTDLTSATTRLKQLQPKRFNFILDPNDTVHDGFMAHEVQTVVPEAISGTHNEVDDDGNPVYQGIDQSKLVPLLTAALQEAITKIETLETQNTTQATQIADLITRVEALEGA
jgi:hypothetical protein